jgi:murein L,D-transpeptidase YcbB/YkuD
VRELISNLICVGVYPPTIISDVFTEDIERAVRKFQRDVGLSVDGIAGPKTRDLLIRYC